VVQVSHTNNHNDAYAASMTLRKACEYLEKKSNNAKAPFTNIYIPIIIVNAPLFSCSLNENNELDLEETKSEIMVEIRAFETPFLKSYTIVQKEYLKEYAEKLSRYAILILQTLDNSITRTSKENPTNSNEGVYNLG